MRTTFQNAIDELRSNDQLIEKGDSLVHRMGSDVIADSGNAAATGGQGVALQMDQMQMESVLASMNKHLAEADALLADPSRFPANPKSENEENLLLARQNLQTVVEQQRAAMNVLYGTVRSNEAHDLQSRLDPVPDDTNGHARVQADSVIDPRPLQFYRKQTQQAEAQVQPIIEQLVEACQQ